MFFIMWNIYYHFKIWHNSRTEIEKQKQPSRKGKNR